MDYVLQIVYCTTLQSSATKKIILSYIKELEKQLLKKPGNHKKSNVPTYKSDTKLSNEYCPFKTKQLNPKVSWQIKRKR